MLGLPGGFARNFNMWGGVGWGGVGWGGVCQRWCSCVHMVRCWCVHVYTWYAAGVMCTHGTLLVCHVQTYHAIAVSCSIVHRSATRCTKSNSTKQHSWQIVSNGNAVNYRWLLIFPPSLDIVKTFNDQLHLKTWHEVFLWTTTCYLKKHSQINTMTTRTTNGCGHSWHVVPVDLVPSRANPPGGANMLQNLWKMKGSNSKILQRQLKWQLPAPKCIILFCMHVYTYIIICII